VKIQKGYSFTNKPKKKQKIRQELIDNAIFDAEDTRQERRSGGEERWRDAYSNLTYSHSKLNPEERKLFRKSIKRVRKGSQFEQDLDILNEK